MQGFRRHCACSPSDKLIEPYVSSFSLRGSISVLPSSIAGLGGQTVVVLWMASPLAVIARINREVWPKANTHNLARTESNIVMKVALYDYKG